MMRAFVLILLVISCAAAWAFDAGEQVFVSEVLPVATSATSPPFVELYNAASTDASLKGWRAYAYTKNGAEHVTLPENAVIPARGFYLIGCADDTEKWATENTRPDFYCALSLAFLSAKGGVYLARETGVTRDAAGWGAVPAPYYEGTAHAAVTDGHSLERKSGPQHDEDRGNSYDTGDNAADLRDRAAPQPQNTQSPREYPSANTEDQAWGRIKAMYYGQR